CFLAPDVETLSRIDFTLATMAAGLLNKLMPAMPLAPAFKHSDTFTSDSPPNAIIGKGFNAAQVLANTAKPSAGPYFTFDLVSNTGPRTAKSAPPSRAAVASASECVDAPIIKLSPNAARTTFGPSERVLRCTPSAPALAAMSARSLTSTLVKLPREISTTRSVSSCSTRAG